MGRLFLEIGSKMKDIHPLKRKSIKPSSSTVRGMLPSKQFRALDAALQSLRATGLRFEWRWVDKEVGWLCAGLYEDRARCELIATEDPLVGRVRLTKKEADNALKSPKLEKKFRVLVENPMSKDKNEYYFELELVTTEARDFFSDFVENVFECLDSELH